ncbi:MAG TPA: SDR family oxidoreductase [Myxococcaceae bacterium]|nr:SDR family oxidoreductase [Myxococcaceae bacterium]
MTLEDARIVVVGGTSGIGLAAATAARRAGARVAVAGRSVEGLERARRADPGLEVHRLDVNAGPELGELFAALGTVDHLVVTAAEAITGRLADLDEVRARAVLGTKVWGPCRVIRAALPRLSPEGSITLFSGAASARASPGFALGSAVNAAVEALAVSLAAELAPVRVNAVRPGIIETPVWGGLPELRAQVFGQVVPRLPSGRAGRAEEVAAAVLFLLASPYVTGSVLTIDGGYLLV